MLKLSHYSVQEYLVSDRLRSSPASFFSIQFNAAQNTLANDTLQYLGSLNAVEPFKPLLDTDDLIFRDKYLLTYCIRFRIEHYKKTTISQQRELAELAAKVFYRSSGNPRYFQMLVEWYLELNWRTRPRRRNDRAKIPCLICVAAHENLHLLVSELAKCKLTDEDRDQIRQDVYLRDFMALTIDRHSQRVLNLVESAENEAKILAHLVQRPYVRSRPVACESQFFYWEIEFSKWLRIHHPDLAVYLDLEFDLDSDFSFEERLECLT